jgi:hypothetical protein
MGGAVKPLCIDLFCGLGGWSEGFLAEGYRVVGFDIERHEYGDQKYPSQLVLQDVTTLHGSQFKNAAVIVASPPCQTYSYMAMPFTRGKAKAAQYRAMSQADRDATLNRLFLACFRIQREASEAAGRHIPLIVENVKGAQPWVGRARANYGSFFLWGDVGMVGRNVVAGGVRFGDVVRPSKAKKGKTNFHYFEETGLPSPSFHGAEHESSVARALANGFQTIGHVNKRNGHNHTRHLTNQSEHDAVKQPGLSGDEWFDRGAAAHGSKTQSRKAASAQIAKIPFALSRYIAQVFKP